MPVINSREKREHSSRSRNLSRNNSIEVRKILEQGGDNKLISGYRPGLPRNRSIERL